MFLINQYLNFMFFPSPNVPLNRQISLSMVRKLFTNSKRVAQSNFFRREIATRMLERLLLIKTVPRYILDAGCGEGVDILALQQYYTNANIIGLDGVYNMLILARKHGITVKSIINHLLHFFHMWLPRFIDIRSPSYLVCADFAQLPFASNTLDMIWSNLALHWHPQPNFVFTEWYRVLCLEGFLIFSCFGPNTFQEVRLAFETIDTTPHVLSFIDMHDFGDMLINTGFSAPVIDMENFIIKYETPQQLLIDLRAWGGNPLKSRRRGLFSRTSYQQLLATLERMRGDDGKISLSCEVIYGHAFRSLSKQMIKNKNNIQLNLLKKI